MGGVHIDMNTMCAIYHIFNHDHTDNFMSKTDNMQDKGQLGKGVFEHARAWSVLTVG